MATYTIHYAGNTGPGGATRETVEADKWTDEGKWIDFHRWEDGDWRPVLRVQAMAVKRIDEGSDD